MCLVVFRLICYRIGRLSGKEKANDDFPVHIFEYRRKLSLSLLTNCKKKKFKINFRWRCFVWEKRNTKFNNQRISIFCFTEGIIITIHEKQRWWFVYTQNNRIHVSLSLARSPSLFSGIYFIHQQKEEKKKTVMCHILWSLTVLWLGYQGFCVFYSLILFYVFIIIIYWCHILFAIADVASDALNT